MGNRPISNGSDEAREEQNATGLMTPILAISPEDGTKLQFSNVSIGGSRGLPLYTDLNVADGSDIANTTELLIATKEPTEEAYTVESEKEDSIHIRNNLSITQQQSEEFNHNITHKLDARSLTIYQDEELWIMVKSPDQVDWSQSRLKIGREAVQEMRA